MITATGKDSSKMEGLLLPEIIAQAESIPAAPGLVGQVLTLTAEPDFSMDQLVKLIRMDPAITAHVLRMCNSPYYGLRHKVASLDHAIAVLGVNALVDVVLSSGLLRVFGAKSQDGYLLDKGQLWRHSVATALIAQKMVNGNGKLKSLNPSITFTAALLHDVGKLALNQFVNQSFYDIESLIYEHHYSIVDAEKQVLGIDHANLGGIMMEKWAFPKEIISTISYHHEPFASGEQIVFLVALANLLAVSAEYGVEASAHHCSHTISEIMQALELDPGQEDDLRQQVIGWLKPAADMLSMLA